MADSLQRGMNLGGSHEQEAVPGAPHTILIQTAQHSRTEIRMPMEKTLRPKLLRKGHAPVTAEPRLPVSSQTRSSTADSRRLLVPLHRGSVQFPNKLRYYIRIHGEYNRKNDREGSQDVHN